MQLVLDGIKNIGETRIDILPYLVCFVWFIVGYDGLVWVKKKIFHYTWFNECISICMDMGSFILALFMIYSSADQYEISCPGLLTVTIILLVIFILRLLVGKASLLKRFIVFSCQHFLTEEELNQLWKRRFGKKS